MSNEQKMVSVPRELLEHITGDHGQASYVMAWKGIRGFLEAPAQHQCEPVALPARQDDDHLSEKLRDKAEGLNDCLDEIAKLGPLYKHADSGEVERLRLEIEQLRFSLEADDHESIQDDCARSENRTLAAEVERLRAENASLRAERDAAVRWQETVRDASLLVQQRDTALSKLAEREALLRRITGSDHQDSLRAIGEAAALLSAGAEPSAPVERDERAEFEAWYLAEFYESSEVCRSWLRRDPVDESYIFEHPCSRWKTWQARAALERKSR